MGRSRRFGLSMFLFVCGCVPSKEAKSAGQIGCSPHEISISNTNTHFGLIQSGETWVAECHGRTFVCSQVNRSGRDASFLDGLFASEQVTCREAPESPEIQRSRRALEMAAAERASRHPSTPPTGAAGFVFGETPEEAARRCEAAGQRWQGTGGDGNPGCSGPAVSLGIPARVGVGFCDGQACSIAIEHVPRANWSGSSVSLKANLEGKYGPPQESSGSVPEQCRTERGFTLCLESRQLTLTYGWHWTAGESLEMSVGKRNDAEKAAIRLLYRRPATAPNLTAL